MVLLEPHASPHHVAVGLVRGYAFLAVLEGCEAVASFETLNCTQRSITSLRYGPKSRK